MVCEVCGKLATYCVRTFRGDRFFCTDHGMKATAEFQKRNERAAKENDKISKDLVSWISKEREAFRKSEAK